MRQLASFIAVAVLGCGLSACAGPEDELSAITPQAFSQPGQAREQQPGQEARPPSGYLAFCDRNPGECRVPRGQPDKIAINDDVWAILEKVNIVVNNAVRPMDDSDHYGVTEFWTVPVDGEGDCEDYVLAKRKMLVLLGLPSAALRITVAVNNRFVRHAVLTVVTTQGDYVLDNAQDDILASEKVDYHWVERQDPASASGWRSLERVTSR
jgi:predicted transglutaminase-like cysteine proteinase